MTKRLTIKGDLIHMFVLDTESPVAQASLKPPIVVENDLEFPILLPPLPKWRLGLQV